MAGEAGVDDAPEAPRRYRAAVRSTRCCSRNGCQQPAVATLTYVYAESTAVVGPLAVLAEPHTYDLCRAHATTLTAPRGWQLVRHDGEFPPPPSPVDDLLALAEAVRELPDDPPGDRGIGGHLRLVPPN